MSKLEALFLELENKFSKNTLVIEELQKQINENSKNLKALGGNKYSLETMRSKVELENNIKDLNEILEQANKDRKKLKQRYGINIFSRVNQLIDEELRELENDLFNKYSKELTQATKAVALISTEWEKEADVFLDNQRQYKSKFIPFAEPIDHHLHSMPSTYVTHRIKGIIEDTLPF